MATQESIAQGAKVCFVTLGCAKNEVDSNDMMRLLREAGYSICDDLSQANAVIVNTCAFIQQATQESIDAVLEVLDAAGSSGRDAPVIITGCMPARYGEDLEAEFPEIAAFVPCAEEGNIVSVLRKCLDGVAGKNAHMPNDAGSEHPCGPGEAISDDGCAENGLCAYVKISDGCDRWCSYCTIPLIRGRYHSFPADEIAETARKRVAEGAKEIVLIGQDTGLWGHDFKEPSSLAHLLEMLAEQFPSTWLRVMYTQPESITDELLACIASHANVCSYLDIPLQHVDSGILKSMNRHGSRRSIEGLIAHIRATVPDVVLRTTLIAGFPGETEDQFEELVDFVENAEFEYVGVFAYSREEGTRAANLDNQLDEAEKEYRASHLRSVADALSDQAMSRRRGKQTLVLVEGCEEDGQLFGRAMWQAPEADGVTYINAGRPGDVVRVQIEDTLMYDMEGVVLQ